MLDRIKLNLLLIVLVSFGSLGLLVNEAEAFYNAIIIYNNSGHYVQGIMHDWSSDRAAFTTSTTTQYYVSAHNRLWGKCSGDMSGCTANRWILKDNNATGSYWASNTGTVYSSHIIAGINVSRHHNKLVPGNGSPTGTGYVSEYGVNYNDGANSACFYNGPSQSALVSTGLPCP